ncbi:MAG: DUF2269 family protein [Thermoleophilaceae bacterium]
MADFLLAVHVLCAVIWVGGGVTMHIFGRLATRQGPERQLEFTKDSIRIGNMLYAPLSVIQLIAGVLLVDELGYGYGDFWITIGFIGFLNSFLIGAIYYSRAGKRYEAVAAGEGAGSPAAQALYRRTANVNTYELTVLLLVVIDMAVKPGL